MRPPQTIIDTSAKGVVRIKLISSVLIDEPRHVQAYLELLYIICLYFYVPCGARQNTQQYYSPKRLIIFTARGMFGSSTQRMRRIFWQNWLYSFAIKEAYTKSFFECFLFSFPCLYG